MAIVLISIAHDVSSQIGLEGIIVEEYYTSTAEDAVPVLGIPGPEVGSKTYRVYADLAPDWQILQVVGYADSPLTFSTTTGFYNATGAGVQFGGAFSPFAYVLGAVPLDSYFSLGFAGPMLAGVPKIDDTDGSIYDGEDRLQGSVNPINLSDGMVPDDGEQLTAQVIGTESLDAVTVNGSSSFIASNTSWFNLNGSKGIGDQNRVLIAQLTTTGDLSFELNIQIANSDVDPPIIEVYSHSPVAGLPSDIGQFSDPGLVFPFAVVPVEGCLNDLACNFNPEATIDDGSCIVPVPDCEVCNIDNTGLILVDTDGDALCDALDPCPFLADLVNGDECTTAEGENGLIADCVCVLQVIEGCTNEIACNYNPEANQNDGSCIIPVENCSSCNSANDGLDIIDADGDGICDAEEILGCTSETACNFNAEATDSSDDCIEPIENCQICNNDNTGLVIVDTDGDGICDAEEISGCTASDACNFNEAATDDDGTCLIPVEDCSACNEDNTALEIIDQDGDGVCDAEEIFGCTDPLAENYNPEATEDDGSCILINTSNQDALNASIKVHPNPTSGLIDVELGDVFSINNNLWLSIADLLGNTLYEREINSMEEGNKINLDLTNLPTGVYILSIRTTDNLGTIRLVKSN